MSNVNASKLETDRPPLPTHVMALSTFIAGSILVCIILMLTGVVKPSAIQTYAAASGAWAWAVYIGLTVASHMLWLPRMWGVVAAGMLFGPVIGACLSLFADCVSGLICYSLGKHCARPWVQAALSRRPKANHMIDLLAKKNGLLTLALIRISPLGHHTLTSYCAGVSDVPTRSFAIGSLLGMLPGAVLYNLLGDSIMQPTSPMFLGSLAAVLAFLVLTVTIAKKTLAKNNTLPTPSVPSHEN